MTVKELANICGVSVATISRAFNEPEKVKPETREMILKLAENYGYFPNVVAKSLREQRTGIFLLTVMSGVERIFEDSYVSKFLKGAVKYFSENGLKLIVDSFTHGDVKKYYSNAVRSKLIDGYILMDIKEDDERIEILKSYNVPFACVGQNSKNDFIYVDTENEKGGYLAAKHLCSLGCKNLLYIGGDPKLPFEKKRLLGFKSAIGECGVKITETFAYYEEEKALEILSSIESFDGIFCTSDVIAYVALRYIEKNHINVPIVGFDNILLSEIAGITTIDQRIELVGEKAAEKVHKLSIGDEVSSEIIDVQLIVRETSKISTL